MLAGIRAGSRQEEERTGELQTESRIAVNSERKEGSAEAEKGDRPVPEGAPWFAPRRRSGSQARFQEEKIDHVLTRETLSASWRRAAVFAS